MKKFKIPTKDTIGFACYLYKDTRSQGREYPTLFRYKISCEASLQAAVSSLYKTFAFGTREMTRTISHQYFLVKRVLWGGEGEKPDILSILYILSLVCCIVFKARIIIRESSLKEPINN